MDTIFKYELVGNFGDKHCTTVPLGSRVLDIEFQGDVIYLWAIVDTNYEQKYVYKKTEELVFEIYGTGWEITDPDRLTHVKTLHVNDYVWHVFKRLPKNFSAGLKLA